MKNAAMVVPAMVISSDGQQPLEYVQPIVNEVQRTTLIDFTEIRQREQEAEMKRNTSTPPETLPNHTW